MKALLFLLTLPLLAADYKAGFGRIDITPAQSIYLSGYAARKKPSEGQHRTGQGPRKQGAGTVSPRDRANNLRSRPSST